MLFKQVKNCRMSENIMIAQERTDVFVASVLERTQSASEEHTPVSFTAEPKCKDDAVAAHTNTTTCLRRAVSIHILLREHFIRLKGEEKSATVDARTGDESNYASGTACPPIEELEKQRFGQKDYATIIKENDVAPNDTLTFAPLPIQVAGHGINPDKNGKLVPGILISSDDGTILKRVRSQHGKPKTYALTEIAFYDHIRKSNNEMDIRIRKCLPRYSGLQKPYQYGENQTEIFLTLENITHGFVLPAVMDIKIGGKKLVKAGSTKDILGYNALGIRSHSLRPEDDGKNDLPGNYYGKSDLGNNIDVSKTKKIMELFFDYERSGRVPDLYKIFIEKLTNISKVFAKQQKYIILGSSLLFAYDADAIRKFQNQKLTKEDLRRFVNIKLVNLAHVYHSNGLRDTQFNKTISNLLELFETFADDTHTKK